MKDRERPFYKILNGHRIPGAFSEDVLQGFLRYEPADDDIFIVTFPKCGTHWAHMMLSATLQVCRGLPPRPFILAEREGVDTISAAPRPRIVCTHLPFRLTPRNERTKYVYVARNPKDCCVSFFHHTKALPSYGFADGTFNEYFEIFLEGLTDFGSYYDNLKSWYARKDDPNILFMTYESMKLDSKGSVIKLAKFVDEQLAAALEEDGDKMRFVLEACSVDRMRKEAQGPFVRKGVVGDWKNYFSPEQSRRLEERFMLEMKGTDIPDLWKDVDWKLNGPNGA
ncbi:amine sulfotransferase-like isoform X2 [Dermacentor variabilis]|uniref:amine sulfotransferase-like isoform X2 n=1 Tax=Dermacentor variabilis TaxID=34621 RepID=UPI003F5C511C